MTDIFNLLIFYLNNSLLFVRIKQTSKSRSRNPEAAIQMCSLKLLFQGKNKKVGKILEKQLGRKSFFSKVAGF